MKTLVLLALCCFLRIGTDAILAEEMSMLKSQILENLKTNGIRNVPNVLTKNDEALKNGNIADKIMKDIDHLLSSLQIGEYDGNDDNSYNASFGATCNWSENSFKCCQTFDLTGNTCLVAKFVGDDINLFVQSGDKMMLIKTMSYKKTLENMFEDVSKLITGDAHFGDNTDDDDFDQENIIDDEQSEILSKEESTNDDSLRKIRCSWGVRSGVCCRTIRIFRHRFRFCIGMRMYPTRTFFYAKIGRVTIMRKYADICSKKLKSCYKIRHVTVCLVLYKLRIAKHNVKGCAYASAYIGWYKKLYPLFCFNKWYRLSEYPEIPNEADQFNVY